MGAAPTAITDTKALALKQACDAAFADPAAKHSCSNSVWDVLKALVDPATPYRQANLLIDAMNAPTNGWRQVSVDEAGALANRGVVVVGGKKEEVHGHVIIVYPGPPIPGGGYSFTLKDGSTAVMRSHGLRPPCMSTSIGSWPGAMSCGEKNVFDPWGNDASFAQVKFWTLNKP